jgi:hypothetical protein
MFLSDINPQCIITCRTNAHRELLGIERNAPIGAYCHHFISDLVYLPNRVRKLFNALVDCAGNHIVEPLETDSAAKKAEYQQVIDAFRGLPSRVSLAARCISERVGAARQMPVLQSIIECLAQHDADASGDRHMQCSP